MSKSYREKKDYETDNENSKHKYNNPKNKRKEKQIYNALRSKNLTELIKYSEDE